MLPVAVRGKRWKAAKMRLGASTLDRINLDPGVSTLEIEIDMVNPMSRSDYPEEKAHRSKQGADLRDRPPPSGRRSQGLIILGSGSARP